MTTNDAATLLRTYAEALAEAHPVPADRTDVAGLVFDVDEEPSAALDLDIALLEAPEAPAGRQVGRLTAVALGLAAALALVAGYALLTDDSDVRTGDGEGASGFVFEGETVLSDDPLIVAASAPVEPTFDTSSLGERFQLTSIESLDEPGVQAFLDRLPTYTNREATGRPLPATTVKITLVGLDGLDPAAILVTDTKGGIEGYQGEVEGYENPDDAIVRTRWSVDSNGAGGAGDFLPPDDELFKLRTPDTFADFLEERGRFSFGSDRVEGNVEPARSMVLIDVSLDVAVLQYVTDGEPIWTVPIGGVAVLPTWLNEESVVEIFLYSTTGQQLYPQPG